ncbi:hypothetical protein Tco_0710937 [Tanacetum coccineum]
MVRQWSTVVRRHVDTWTGGVDPPLPPLIGGPWLVADGDGKFLKPGGTTQVVTRGHLMIECQICRYEVACWTQSEHDTWATGVVSNEVVRVSVQRSGVSWIQCQSLAIMRRLVGVQKKQ